MPRLLRIAIFGTAVTLAVPALATDCDFAGGFALRQSTQCSGNASMSCSGGFDGFWSCCPNNSFCTRDSKTQNAICCPQEGVDCWKDVVNVPHCPSNDWSLWGVGNYNASYAWCCNSGSYGVWFNNDNYDGGQLACYGDKAAPSSNSDAINATTVATSTLTSTCTSIGASTTVLVTQTGSPATTSASSHNDGGSQSSSISKGAIAGIVVGVVAGVSLLAAAAWFIVRHRRSNKYQAASTTDPAVTDKGATPDGGYNLDNSELHRPMADSQPISELGEGRASPLYELPANNQR